MDTGFLGDALAPILGIMLAVLSLSLGARVMWSLAANGRWLRLLIAIPVALVGPTLLFLTLRAGELPNGHPRDWYLITGVGAMFAWVYLWGFAIMGLGEWRASPYKAFPLQWTARRRKGALLVLVGLTAWILGATATAPSRWEGAVLLLVWGYGCFVGTYWLAVGERIND